MVVAGVAEAAAIVNHAVAEALVDSTAVAEAIEARVPVWRYRKADRSLRELWAGFAREILS